jgi:hypothetical protein
MSANEKAEVFLIIIKRIGKWFLAIISVLIFIFFVSYVYIKVNDFIEKRPKIITDLKGVRLGEKYSDFVFRNPGFKKSKVNLTTANEINYINEENRLSVSLINGKVESVYYYCGPNSDFTNVNGISCDDFGDKVIEIFAKELRILCGKDKNDLSRHNVRVYDIVKYGVRYFLFNNKVGSVMVTSPEILAGYIGKNWDHCE